MSWFCFTINSNTRTATLIVIDGKAEEVKLPMTAAELILEHGTHYIISAADMLRKTGRVMAMRADEELLPGKTYVLFLARKVNSKVSEMEIEALKKQKKKKLVKFKGKILSAVAVEMNESCGDEIHHVEMVVGNNSRQCWKPVLEPIPEVHTM